MIRRFLRLAGVDRRLIMRATMSVLLARMQRRSALALVRESVLRSGDTEVPAVPSGRMPTSPRVGWAIGAVAHRLPGRNSCLVQAVAADRLLRRYGFDPRIRIGVNNEDDFVAHAWVECEGRVVVGATEEMDFREMTRARDRS